MQLNYYAREMPRITAVYLSATAIVGKPGDILEGISSTISSDVSNVTESTGMLCGNDIKKCRNIILVKNLNFQFLKKYVFKILTLKIMNNPFHLLIFSRECTLFVYTH